MSLLIFIPGKFGPNLDHLAEVGLGDLLREGDRGPNASDLVHGGPGGTPGVLFSWGVAQYKPDAQSWTPCKPDPARGLAAGRFWLGFDKAKPPGPDDPDLVRDEPARLDGYLVKLADGNQWAIPNGMLLPCRFTMDDEGNPARVPCREVAAIHERTLWAFEALKHHVETHEPPPWRESLEYAAFLLSLNYRLNLEIALTLGLFDERNLGRILKASTDIDALLAIQRDVIQKKTASDSDG